jgi:hypothetical protein
MRIRGKSKGSIVIGVSVIAIVLGIGIACENWRVTASADDFKPDVSLNAFMRKKLDSSSMILEGLTVEDSELIVRGAKELLQLSKVEKWQVLVDSEYREFSDGFRVTVKRLEEAAQKGNYDNAAIQWFDTMKSCVECHQHVRNVRARKK